MYPATIVKKRSTICTVKGTVSPSLPLGGAEKLCSSLTGGCGVVGGGGDARKISGSLASYVGVDSRLTLTNQFAEDFFMNVRGISYRSQ